MKNGRSFIKEISKDKNVLNLFSYTCAFSVCAISAGASKVVNVDMAKNALTTGRTNHHLNNLENKSVDLDGGRIIKKNKYDEFKYLVVESINDILMSNFFEEVEKLLQ